MKNVWIRALSLVLCLLMLAPYLIACGDTGAETTPVTTTPADTTPPPEVLPTDIVKIRITKDALYDENGFIELEGLVDEFDLVDPAADPTVYPESKPKTGGGWKDQLGLALTIDLGADYYISSVFYYNQLSRENITVSAKSNRLDHWTTSVTGIGQTRWTEVKMDVECHYLHLSAPDASSTPAEIVVYGYRTSAYDPVPTRAERTEYPTLSEFMGLNGNIAASVTNLMAGTYVREYHNWLWTEMSDRWGTDLPYAAYISTPVGNFDSFYMMADMKGLKVVPCIMFTDDHALFESGQSRPSSPLADGTYDSDNALTYNLYAAAIYQYAARYGSNDFTTIEGGDANHEHDWGRYAAIEGNDLIKTRTCSGCGAVQTQNYTTIRVSGAKKTGLGYIDYIELGNEPNLDWEHVDDYHSPFQLAALTSASYDGHEGAMGAGYGAKTADPNIKVAMGGLAGIPLDYIRSMDLWAKFNRQDGELPMDVINVHSYCEENVKVGNRYYVVGVSPEQFGLAEALQDLVEWRDTYYPDKEIWLTEFGWDTSGKYSSSVSVHEYADYTTRQIQAMWLVRAYLLLSASGIDKAHWFMCDGQNDDDGGRFATCGLIDGNGRKKESWYYMRTLLTTMGDMAFVEEIETGRDDLMIYHYKNAEGKSGYAVWCPTSDGTKVENYTFTIDGSAADLVEFADKQDHGITSALTVNPDGTVTVNASERPVLVITK